MQRQDLGRAMSEMSGIVWDMPSILPVDVPGISGQLKMTCLVVLSYQDMSRLDFGRVQGIASIERTYANFRHMCMILLPLFEVKRNVEAEPGLKNLSCHR